MIKTIREFVLSIIFAWGLLAVVLMMRHYDLMFENNTLDNTFVLIYFTTTGVFVIYTVFYAIHSFKNTKSRNPFRSPSFEEDERETIIDYKSRKAAHSFLINIVLLSVLLVGMLWRGNHIPINPLLIIITIIFTISQLVETIVWIKEYRR